MNIEFTKMHGAGNDYIYIDCFRQSIADPAALAVIMSPRHTSVGSDGVILVMPSDIADGRMRIFNADGSEGKMCGNGIRCVAKFLWDNGYTENKDMSIETASGIRCVTVKTVGDKAVSASVDMGFASFAPESLPVISDSPVIDGTINGRSYTCVSMGNPHAVTFTEGIASLNIEDEGTAMQSLAIFPESVNVEFCETDDDSLSMRVWERGSGETFACGTGACASVAAAVKTGRLPMGKEIPVSLRGGKLGITCGTDFRMTMTGEAVEVYKGVFAFDE